MWHEAWSVPTDEVQYRRTNDESIPKGKREVSPQGLYQ